MFWGIFFYNIINSIIKLFDILQITINTFNALKPKRKWKAQKSSVKILAIQILFKCLTHTNCSVFWTAPSELFVWDIGTEVRQF